MSGQSIGTVLGGAIGFAIGGGLGARIGMVIGGAVGSVVKPDVIEGPHVGDGQPQQATDGTAIARVFGTAWVTGTVIDVGPRREVKKEDDGKGGPTQVTYEAHQDFVVLICESDELRGSSIVGVAVVEQDGKIVYDVRPGSAIADDSAKFAENVTFYVGDEGQLPPSLVETIHGAGQNPAYRGVALACFEDFNLTPAGGRIPAFRFLVSGDIAPVPTLRAFQYDVQNDSTTGYNIQLPKSIQVGDRIVLQTGFVLQYNTTRLIAPVDFTTLLNTVYANNGAILILTKIASGSDAGRVLSFTAPSAIDWTTIIYVVKRGTFDPGYVGLRASVDGLGGYMQFSTPDARGAIYMAFAFNNKVVGADYSDTLPTVYPFADNQNAKLVRRGYMATSSQTTTSGSSNPNPAYNWRPNQSLVAIRSNILTSDADRQFSLSRVVDAISTRGGVSDFDVDSESMESQNVAGYAIGTQTSGANALGPLLKAHFAYMSEYNGKLNFRFMGADAVLTIDEDDLVDTGDSAVVETQRENATEYPRRIIAQYYDVDQNYMPATVTATRTAAGVAGSGDQGFDIPVAMTASQAQQAVDKAMKAAYAALDGSVKITVPFATKSGCYLRLVAGDAVLFRGRRWIITRETLGAQTLALEMQADRQSAYTSNVQAVSGRPLIAPESRYSGPTRIIPMSLPPLRSQDSPGIYAVTYSDPFDTTWKVASVQMSMDAGATWQQVGVSTIDGDIGTLTQPDGGASLTVQMRGDLSSVTSAQLDANQNAAALIHGSTIEVLQFGTAAEDETTPHRYTLTDLRRHQAKTTQVTGAVGDQFVPLKAATFVPVDIAFAGQTLLFRAVGYGEKPDDAVVASVVYNPVIPGSDPMGALQTEGGDYIMTEAGDYLLTS